MLTPQFIYSLTEERAPMVISEAEISFIKNSQSNDKDPQQNRFLAKYCSR